MPKSTKPWMGEVRAAQCETCIYRPGCALNIERLEDQVRDRNMGFRGFRICHTSGGNVCCRGFWDRHKDEFAAGQIAQRLGLVEFVDGPDRAGRKSGGHSDFSWMTAQVG